ncbi:Acetyltransferase (GNAT) family protein [compost metagenome]
MHRIIPFEQSHQEGISRMMNEIQQEFDTTFRKPGSKTISDIASEDDLFWVALYENQVVGTIGLTKIDDRSGLLRHLFVSKEHRGSDTGVSKKLLERAFEEAKKRNYTFLYLGTMDQFKAAQKFYSRNQFMLIPQESLPENMPVNSMDTLFYARYLPNEGDSVQW